MRRVRSRMPLTAASRQELQDRRLQTFAALRRVVDLDVGEALRAVARDERACNRRSPCATVAPPPGTRSAATRPFGSAAGPANTLNSTSVDEVGDIDELERVAQVGLVGTEAAHRFGVTSCAGTGSAASRPCTSLKKCRISASISRHDFVLRQERGLDVELRELGLPIGAQVFVAEAACTI